MRSECRQVWIFKKVPVIEAKIQYRKFVFLMKYPKTFVLIYVACPTCATMNLFPFCCCWSSTLPPHKKWNQTATRILDLLCESMWPDEHFQAAVTLRVTFQNHGLRNLHNTGKAVKPVVYQLTRYLALLWKQSKCTQIPILILSFNTNYDCDKWIHFS